MPVVSSTTITLSKERCLCSKLSHYFNDKISNIHNNFELQPDPSNLAALLPTQMNPQNPTMTTWTTIFTSETTATMLFILSGAPSEPCPYHIFSAVTLIFNNYINTATIWETWK